MSKTLYLIRHADAEDGQGMSDKQRHLSSKGREQSAALAKLMRDQDLSCDYALLSSSNRTVETFDHMGVDIDSEKLDGLYNGTPEDYLDAMHMVDDRYDDVMMIGHNPTCAMLAIQLAVEGTPADLIAIRAGFKKSQCAVLHFSVENWADVKPRQGYLSELLLPKV